LRPVRAHHRLCIHLLIAIINKMRANPILPLHRCQPKTTSQDRTCHRTPPGSRRWKSGLTKIHPAKDFQGDLGHSSWLQNEDLAFIYRAYSSYDKPLTITSPGNCWPTVPALDPGASTPILVDASRFPNWKTIAFYDGAKRLGEITQGPAQFTATNLTPGYHVFSVLATDGQGTVRTADPKMVVVRAASLASHRGWN
jgi:hypothetical protein